MFATAPAGRVVAELAHNNVLTLDSHVVRLPYPYLLTPYLT